MSSAPQVTTMALLSIWCLQKHMSHTVDNWKLGSNHYKIGLYESITGLWIIGYDTIFTLIATSITTWMSSSQKVCPIFHAMLHVVIMERK